MHQSENEEQNILYSKNIIEKLENSYNLDTKIIEKLSLNEIKSHSNIRDDYEYEQIEELANDILLNGQLQPVLITKDNVLLSGYRRYFAVKFLLENPELFSSDKIPDEIVVYRIEQNISDLTDDKIENIQLSENNQRKSIDNFQLSKLFNRYIDKGYTQKYLADKFNKSKSFVSFIIAIKNIDNQLVTWLKEFQVYAWSKKKFTGVNLSEREKKFYERNRVNHGWKPLYDIAKQNDVREQKKKFLKYFGDRLSDDELDSEYFQDIFEEEEHIEHYKFKKVFKYLGHLSNSIDELEDELSDNEFNELKLNIDQITSILEEVSESQIKRI
jgi:ParB/RepB/Spo0J family partition protein